VQNPDCYEHFNRIGDDEELGHYLIEELETAKIPGWIENHFDYESYGRDFRINNGGVFVDTGFVYRNRNVDFIEHYNGRDDIPEEYRVFDFPITPERSTDLSDAKITQSMPIAGNGHVAELLNLLEANNMPGAKELNATINQVSAMEKHLAAMVNQLAAMNQALAEAQKMNHPLRNAMQKAVITLQAQALDIRDKLSTLKQNLIVGCKNALAAFEDKGLSALRDLTQFFKIQPGLESLRKDINKYIKLDETQIANFEKANARYHKAGMYLANTGRALVGKEAIQEPKPMGKIAKAFIAPTRADLACLKAMDKCVGRAIGAVDRLKNIERKPPIKETLEKHNKQVAEQAQRDAPHRVRPRPVGSDR